MGFKEFFGGFNNENQSEQEQPKVENKELSNVMPEKVMNELPTKPEDYPKPILEVPSTATEAQLNQFKKHLEEIIAHLNEAEIPKFN